MSIDVTALIQEAKKHLSEVFGVDNDSIYLEEVVSMENGGWLITFSYYESPSQGVYPNKLLQSILESTGGAVKRYKVVELNSSGDLKGIRKHGADR